MKKQLEYVDRNLGNIIERRIKVNSSKTAEEDGRKYFLPILLDLRYQKDAPTSSDIRRIKVFLSVSLSFLFLFFKKLQSA